MRVGVFLSERRRIQQAGELADFGVMLSATLTLLSLIIGFTFSMAISRYDQRKKYEEVEANSIRAEYIRADLLPATASASIRALLKKYLDERILFYNSRDQNELRQINSSTEQLQSELWAAVAVSGGELNRPVIALAVSGMNNVFDSQGSTQAAWWNRIPTEAWVLMVIISICSNVLSGFVASRPKSHKMLLLLLPFVLSISFTVVADIDSPRGGVIRVDPQNLESLAAFLRGH